MNSRVFTPVTLISPPSNYDQPPKESGESASNELSAPASANARRMFLIWSVVSFACYASLFLFLKITDHDAGGDMRHTFTTVILAALMLSYAKAYVLICKSEQITVRLIAITAACNAIVAASTPYFFSKDIFCYVNVGWLQFHFHRNPYVHLVCAAPGFASDPMFTNVWSVNPLPYGFVFAHITREIARLGNGDLMLTLGLLKALNLISFAGLAATIWKVSKTINQESARQNLFLYMASPLILLHSLADGHNDIIMTFFVGLGYLLSLSGPVLLVIPVMMLGIMVKYLWAYALPFVLIYLKRQFGWKVALGNAAIAIGLLFAISWTSYLCDWSRFRFDLLGYDFAQNCNSLVSTISDATTVIGKLMYPVQLPASFVKARDAMVSGSKILLTGAFCAFSVALLYRACLKKEYLTFQRLIEMTVLGSMLWVTLVSGKFYPWYPIMYLPIALMLPVRSEVRRLALILSCTQLFGATFIGKTHIVNFLLMTLCPIVYTILRLRGLKATQIAPTKA